MLALDQYESEICDCGNHVSVTDDPANVFMPTERVCKVCAGADQYARIQQDRDEAAIKALGDKPPPTTPLPTDGRRTYLRPLSPAEVAEARSTKPN